ncbi:DUF4185 domain-containing protein [Mycobacterium sp. ITM-2016-00317]|uniref:DUF4185 domain-containing protein n=1 Tax=Mycobacterium sp. ITM-2016-00317 TaxID=2099694 RepID=UPI00287F9550|nr:DUF4185 domain-containing protein [Mycobacterium sp. ITM-2016-00317]WNG86893.1 DUF4185 domain-containing protein [Mycobacterium sp. ITM-2016-00317]
MGSAAYVGRVGGLAVALGVGTAVFAGQGVAWADDTDSSTTSSSTSASSDTDRAETSRAAGRTADTTGTESEPQQESEPDDESAAAPEEDPAGDPAETGDDTDAEPEEEPESEADPVTAPEEAPKPVDTEPVDAGEDDTIPDDTTSDDPDDAAVPAPPKTTPATRPETSTGTKAEEQDQKPTDQKAADKTSADAPDDPGVPPQDPKKVAVFASATKLAEAGPKPISPKVAALLTTEQDQAAVKKPTLITAVVNVVNSMLDWARQKAEAKPGDAPTPPFLWALLSFARRELDNLFAARSTTNAPRGVVVTPTSLALADDAAAAAALVPSYSPWLNPQVSASTRFISWVTGTTVYGGNKELANTLARFGVHGTDVGVMWDNGMVDDPNTDFDERQILIAVGDTFGAKGMTGRWIYNTLFRSSDRDLSDGMTIPDGEWYNGNMFGGAPLSGPTEARPIINRPSWLPNSVTLIPTAGVSLPTEVTEDTPFGTIQYVSFMSVSNWGQAGRWSTNYSAIAYSTDNGENFKVAPESVRYNSFLSGNRNFQQSAFVKGNDGYVYVYGTPNGRQGAAYVARVAPEDILNVGKYEYYKAASTGWFGGSPAKWVKNSPSSASAVIGKSGGACGSTKPGYTVSEMSVQYNEYLQKYVVLYGDQFNNIVMRTSDTPEGGWSDAKVLMGQQSGGIYAPMLHPWSPSTQGTGSDLYWNLSLWSDYNIMLMKTDLTKL